MNEKTVIAVVGPTAVGKTAVAIKLAQHFQTEIVSADARQIFKELNIGTAKPTEHELAMAKHHFVNSHSIHDDFNAGTFALEAEELIKLHLKSHPYVILCGGSGLYIKALLSGFDEMPDVPHAIRKAVIGDYQKHGLEWLQQSVMEADPVYYYPIDKLNPQRLMRALEVYRASGKPFSSFRLDKRKELLFSVIKVGLNMDRQELYARINQRMDQMIAEGLFEEAAALYPKRNLNALQTVGYQEIFDFMDGKYDRNEAVRLLKQNSRRYAKRQLTWFQNDKEIQWFHPKDYDAIVQFIQEKSTIL